MNNYIATFFSHYDALLFYDFLQEKDITARLMPVPRRVSASCGTCVSFAHNTEILYTQCEMEAIYIQVSDGFRLLRNI
ncbi:MAG: DUF3343 domain-containing protein [Defluviitaleaceae bacterium]|nr:DUF3343 domain-containing protein [Defluviitaleaceae bacterium]